MTTHSVGEFKARFSAILDEVRRGGMVAIHFGRARKPVAILVPPATVAAANPRRIGRLARKASFRIKPGFKMTDDELLGS